MLLAVLQPSQSISLGFEGYSLRLKDGTTYTGYLSGESEHTLSLRMMGGIQMEFDVSTIESRLPMEQSLMPEGLDQVLTSEELIDLVGWLMDQKGGPSNPVGALAGD